MKISLKQARRLENDLSTVISGLSVEMRSGAFLVDVSTTSVVEKAAALNEKSLKIVTSVGDAVKARYQLRELIQKTNSQKIDQQITSAAYFNAMQNVLKQIISTCTSNAKSKDQINALLEKQSYQKSVTDPRVLGMDTRDAIGPLSAESIDLLKTQQRYFEVEKRKAEDQCSVLNNSTYVELSQEIQDVLVKHGLVQ